MKSEVEKTPIDSGYSWVIVTVCSFHVMFVIGGIKSFGIYYTEMLEYYGTGASNTAWIGSLSYICMFALGPFSAYLVEKISFRLVTFTGGFLCFVGYLSSAFVCKMEIMYVTIGVIAGIGYGLIYPPSMTIISFFFDKHRALANGIASAGSGIGGFLFPYLFRALIDQYMLPGALMITAAIYLHLCTTALLLRQPMQLVRKNLRYNGTSITENMSESKGVCFNIIDWSLFKNLSYLIYTTSLVIQTTGDLAVFIVFPAHMTALGFSKQNVTLAFSLTGISEIISRTFIGWLADRKCLKVKNILLFAILMNGISALLIPHFKHYFAQVLYGVFMGAFPGAFWGLLPVLLTECVGLDRLPKAYGFMILLSPISAALGQPIAGWIKDGTGSWENSFRYAAGCNFLGAAVLLMEPLLYMFCNRDRYSLTELEEIKHDTDHF